MNRKAVLVWLVMALTGVSTVVRAQYDPPSDQPSADVQLLGDSQLDQITGPIALYPDPLVAQILPAATQPEQIAMAYSYVTQGGDPNGIDSQPWDESVKAVAHYPDVIRLMDGDLSWTTQLGDAFVNQPSDVMNSIQRLRAQAQELGNLQSTPQQEVDTDDGEIEILPADPNEIYVPVYDPGLIYYRRSYGVPFLTFGVGFGIGLWLNHDFDWHRHNVVVWGHDHPRPANFWHERPVQRHEFYSHATPWHAPAGRIEHRPVIYNNNRGFVNRTPDRGYAPRAVQPRPAHVEPRPVHVEPQHVEPPRAVGRPPEVHTIPARPTVQENVHVAAPEVHANVNVHVSAPGVSVFGGARTAGETRAASSRGMESRGAVGGGAPHPTPSAPHAGPSSGGGGGGHAPGGGGGGNNGKR
jgi:hypothetical protein